MLELVLAARLLQQMQQHPLTSVEVQRARLAWELSRSYELPAPAPRRGFFARLFTGRA